jgi:hypothetical protein
MEKRDGYYTDWISDPYRVTSLDPELLFRFSFERIHRHAQGVEYLVYQLIPLSVIRSFAAAIDPFYKFKVSPVKVSPANRSRSRSMNSVLDLRRIRNREEVYGTNMVSNEIIDDGKAVDNQWVTNLPQQQSLPIVFNDTTRRTRPRGSENGEFDSFKFHVYSAPMTVRYSDVIDSWSGSLPVGTFNRSYTRRIETYQHDGPARRLTESSRNNLLNYCQTKASGLLNEKGPKLVAQALPASRDMTMFRSIAELKDLPRSILQLRRTLGDLKRFYQSLSPEQIHALWKNSGAILKDIPREYLGYVFGWKQMYRDGLQLLSVPNKISKRIAYLQSRSGVGTTFRSSMGLPIEEGPGFPSVYLEEDSFPGIARVSDRQYTLKHSVKPSLRVTLNAKFDFPTVAIPEFQAELFRRKLGVVPTFADLYELIPWSWLLDWSIGIGNYLESIETINSDRSLVNWGVITCFIEGDLAERVEWTEHHLSTRLSTNPFTAVNMDKHPRCSYECRLQYTYKTRKSLANGYGVSTIDDVGSLTPYQLSILGALIAARR